MLSILPIAQFLGPKTTDTRERSQTRKFPSYGSPTEMDCSAEFWERDMVKEVISQGDKNLILMIFQDALPLDQRIQSPYLPSTNIPLNDDGYIYYNSEKPVRGRLEHSFFEIGMAVLAGGALGSTRGFIEGKEAAVCYPHNLKKVVVFNHMVKKSTLGNSFGIVATIYATCGVIISEVRGIDGPGNTLLAATLTGLLYKVPGGVMKMARGGMTGFTVGTLLALWQERRNMSNRIRSYIRFA